jgi:hypothetical protein
MLSGLVLFGPAPAVAAGPIVTDADNVLGLPWIDGDAIRGCKKNCNSGPDPNALNNLNVILDPVRNSHYGESGVYVRAYAAEQTLTCQWKARFRNGTEAFGPDSGSDPGGYCTSYFNVSRERKLIGRAKFYITVLNSSAQLRGENRVDFEVLK